MLAPGKAIRESGNGIDMDQRNISWAAYLGFISQIARCQLSSIYRCRPFVSPPRSSRIIIAYVLSLRQGP